MRELSILIPSRNEMFLKNTIDDALSNIEADTEIIVVLDGEWADPAIEQNDRVNVIYLNKPIGQRAATNLACKLSQAKYVMKVDAHCAFDKGFDRKLINDMQDDITMVPVMKNLHAFDWKCFKCGRKVYQDEFPKCPDCGNKMRRKIVWKPRRGTHNYSYCFDAEPHFQYFSDYSLRPEYKKALEKGNLTETMSLQGSCFICTRERYWSLKICDEDFGSWGNQGIEVAVKTWLSGGRVVCNHNTWYAHMFRTKSHTGFGFPYPQSGKEIAECKRKVRDLFFNNKWEKQIHPLSWLLKKFWSVPGWTDDDLKKLI